MTKNKPLMISKLCEQFLKHNEINCVSIIDQNDEGSFSYAGCDCCNTGLGNTVYSCNGYSPKHKKVFDVGEICGDCIGYFYNGDDCEVAS